MSEKPDIAVGKIVKYLSAKGIAENRRKEKLKRFEMEIRIEDVDALPDVPPEELARVIAARFGLLPRKKDGTAQMHSLLIELYERKKSANR